MTDTELDLIPMMTLMDAVCRRFDSAIILGARSPGVGTERMQTVYRYKGGAIVALGLAEMMKLQIASALDPEAQPMDNL